MDDFVKKSDPSTGCFCSTAVQHLRKGSPLAGIPMRTMHRSGYPIVVGLLGNPKHAAPGRSKAAEQLALV